MDVLRSSGGSVNPVYLAFESWVDDLIFTMSTPITETRLRVPVLGGKVPSLRGIPRTFVEGTGTVVREGWQTYRAEGGV